MGNIGDSFFQFQIALLVTMAFLAEQSKLDINLRSQFSQMRVAGRNINQSVCVGGKTFLEFCMNFINTFPIKLDMNFDYLFRSSYMPV